MLYGGLEITVRGSQDAHIHGHGQTAAHALELPLLEHAQERDLGVGGKLPDFIQEDRPAVGRFEPPEPALQRARERPLFVPEQLRGDERRWNGRAVHPNEGASRSPRPLVNGARDQLLAGPGFTQDEHRRIGLGHLRHLRQDGPQGRG